LAANDDQETTVTMIRQALLAGIAAMTSLAGAGAAAAGKEAMTAPAMVPARPEIYAPVTLAVDLSALTASERQMLGLFIEAGEVMDDLYWRQTYGDRDALLKGITDTRVRDFVLLNYGPWDRLADNAPFVPGVGTKPDGAQFYPHDMTREEFEKANLPQSRSEYTLLRRDATGGLKVVPYHVEYREALGKAAARLEQAAALAADPALKKYLTLRARALLTDDYRASDLAWLDMKSNRIDVVIGPIETHEDALFGYKAAYESFALIKDMEWSKRLERYAAMLPELQRGLPVADAYKAEKPGTDSDLNAYDVVHYAGHCNVAAKVIAINLPNDEQVQLEKGARRLQLKNAMRAKFDKIMLPIADELIWPEQHKNVTFDAFFANVMFHEVAHGLGIKNTLDGKGTVRDALKEQASWLEEGKADILGLYMITKLHEKGELGGSLEDYYVTFLTGIFRSVRWGAAQSHGQANMVRFNYFADRGAFSRDANGHYRVDLPKMRKAMDELSADILKLQGDGDYAGVQQLLARLGVLHPQLSADLARLGARNIPVDVRFEQGKAVLGLK
jgi:Peptidase family M49